MVNMANRQNKSQVLEEYLKFRKVSVNTENKMKLYRYFTKMFITYSNKPLKDFQETDLINFINSLSKKYSVGTMNEVKVYVKSFIRWYFRDYPERFRNIDKICRSQLKERTYQPEQMLTKEDVQKLVQNENETRWKAFWLLYFYGGFRPGEVNKLEWKSITFDKEGAFVKVYVKKNNKTFDKYIPEDVCFYLKKLQQNNSKYVFPTKRTNKKGVPVGDMPQTTSGVYQRIIKLSKQVLGKQINPYILRHSIATILYNRDDLKDDDVAMQMGHSRNMKNTYNNLSVDKIRERMKKIYIQPEDLPPEKKEEYEKKIETMLKDIQFLKEQISKITVDKNKYIAEVSEEAKKWSNLLDKKMSEKYDLVGVKKGIIKT